MGLSASDGVSKTLENTAFVLGTINSLDGGSKITKGLIESGQSLMKAGNKIAWGNPHGQGWKKGMHNLSGWRDLNPRSSGPKPDALAPRLHPALGLCR